MAQKRFGQECERCRQKIRKGEEVYLAQYIGDRVRWYRGDAFLLCCECAELHVKSYIFLSYLVFVGGVSKP